MKITAQELNELLNGKLVGNPSVVVDQPAKIEEAQPNELSFIANPKYEAYANTTQAGILIVREDFEPDGAIESTLIKVKDPYQSFTQLLEYYNSQKPRKVGVEDHAVIHESAQLGKEVYVGAFSYIGENVKIGSNVSIHPHVHIGDNVEIGAGTILHPGVKIYRDCEIGKDCIIHSGTVVGSDGFGFATHENGVYTKIPQTGNVVIRNRVEIGANCCIDRATMGSTIIGSGVKLDNLIQVAHNVQIGANTVIASQTGVSGSTKLGENCIVGGQVGFVGHLNIAPGTKVQAQSGVSKSISQEGKAIAGSPAFDYHQNLKSQVIFRNLPALEQRMRELEQKLRELDNTQE